MTRKPLRLTRCLHARNGQQWSAAMSCPKSLLQNQSWTLCCGGRRSTLVSALRSARCRLGKGGMPFSFAGLPVECVLAALVLFFTTLPAHPVGCGTADLAWRSGLNPSYPPPARDSGLQFLPKAAQFESHFMHQHQVLGLTFCC